MGLSPKSHKKGRSMRTIAIAGQLDTFAAHYSRQLAREVEYNELIGIGDEAYDGFGIKHWRLASLISQRDSTDVLANVNLAYYFCLTPPSSKRTPEGLEGDVALLAAYNFAREASRHPELRVVLVLRIFSEDSRKLGPIYHFWREVRDIFKETCPNLVIVRMAPMLSSLDPLAMALVEHARTASKGAFDTRGLNLVQAQSLGEAMLTLDKAADASRGQILVSEGAKAISYIALIEELRKHIKTHFGIKEWARLTALLTPQKRLNEALLTETIEFHSLSDIADHQVATYTTPVEIAELCRELVLETKDDKNSIAVKSSKELTKRFKIASTSACYVQRVAMHPKRSVSVIADLLMQWLPQYFRRLLRFETADGSRRIGRIYRVPVFELEKFEQTPKRCLLRISSPWARSVKSYASLSFIITGEIESPRELLAVIEDGPDAAILTLLQRGILHAFARYLREYGVAD